jgi:hypothetical protein
MSFDAIVESDTPKLGLGNSLVSVQGDILVWPWPRMIATKYHIFLLTLQLSGELYISEILLENSRIIPTVMGSLGLATLIESVDIADFGVFYVISTFGITSDEVPVASINTYIKDLLATEFPRIIPFSTPSVGTVCNFRNQFVGANVINNPDSLWSDLKSDGIVWSGIGNFDLDPGSDFTSGFMKGVFSRSSGMPPVIYKVKELEGHHFQGTPMVVVYSNVGKFILVPNSTSTGYAFGVSELKGLGVSSGNHIAGDEYLHGFIDTNRDFWTLESPHYSSPAGGNLKKLGYREYILELFNYKSSEDHRVIVSYIPKDGRFYISNGNKCLVINQFGACHISQCPSSVIKAPDGLLYGTFKNLPDTSAYIVSNELDFGTRGLKSIESVFGGMDANSNSQINFSVDWRKGRGDQFSRLSYRPANPRGEARIGVTAEEFRLVVNISNYIQAQIQWLMMNVKFPDNRFRRGTTLPDTNIITRQGQ